MAEVQTLLGGTTAVASQPGDPIGQTPNGCVFQQQDPGGHLLVVTVRGSFTKAKSNDLMAQFSGTAVSAVGVDLVRRAVAAACHRPGKDPQGGPQCHFRKDREDPSVLPDRVDG